MTKRLPMISLFSGALGLDLGIEAAGFDLRVAVEPDDSAVRTIKANRPGVQVINRPIEEVSTAEILDAAKLRPGEPALVTGGPCCQSFSTAGQRGSLTDPRGNLFLEFLRVVHEAQPRFFVMENVRGILSAAIRHRPLKERGPGQPVLQPDEELGSAFVHILEALRTTGYFTIFDLLNAADYGTPQTRERLFFLGSRDCEPIEIPPRTHALDGVDGLAPWVTLEDAILALKDADPIFPSLSKRNRRFLAKIPAGGNWRDLPEKDQKDALGGAYFSWGGRSGFLRRLDWDRPAPSLTTRVDSRATMMCHPTELRPLTVRECATLQQFPHDWQFHGGLAGMYRQVGNAVPVGLASALGHSIRKTIRRRKRLEKPLVACPNWLLVEQQAEGERTRLNPKAMRDCDSSKKEVNEWLNWSGEPPVRRRIRDLVKDYESLNFSLPAPQKRGQTSLRAA